MKLYIYAKSAHPESFENVPRSAAEYSHSDVANLEFLEKYNIPIVRAANLDALKEDFYRLMQAYLELYLIKSYDASWLEEEMQIAFKANEHILPAIDYGYSYAK